jgi:uncharacterized protein (TIGR03118 family)
MLAGLLAGLSGLACAQRYDQTNLTSDVPGWALHTDPHLVNPWGLAFFPGNPFWISDNNGGASTLYDNHGSIVPLVVAIPGPMGSTAAGTPTGIVANGADGFVVNQNGVSGTAFFIFDTEDGTLSGWNPNVNLNSAVTTVDNSQPGGPDHSRRGAVYKGLAIATTTDGTFLYATNFRDRKVEIYDANFQYVKSFRDPKVPKDYAPFGVQAIGGKIYVTYAQQDAEKHDDVPGYGHGYVDVFNTKGRLLQRLIAGGSLNSPWGIALAPANFGAFSNTLLVGNFGNGWINAFDPNTGAWIGFLQNNAGHPLAIDGLWALAFGGGGVSGNLNQLYFTAGPEDESHGLFGRLAASKK